MTRRYRVALVFCAFLVVASLAVAASAIRSGDKRDDRAARREAAAAARDREAARREQKLDEQLARLRADREQDRSLLVYIAALLGQANDEIARLGGTRVEIPAGPFVPFPAPSPPSMSGGGSGGGGGGSSGGSPSTTPTSSPGRSGQAPGQARKQERCVIANPLGGCVL